MKNIERKLFVTLIILFVCDTFLFSQNSKVQSNTSSVQESTEVFVFPACKYNRLNGKNTPLVIEKKEKVKLRMCTGQIQSFTLLLSTQKKLRDIQLKWNPFKGNGNSLKASAMDVHIAKVWYQAGISTNEVNKKILTQELLLNNDSIIQIDTIQKINYLLVKDLFNKKKYIDISSPNASVPSDVIIEDSPVFLPFHMDEKTNKQLWFRIEIPENTLPGRYNTFIMISSKEGEIKSIPVEVEVLPFQLDESRLLYGIYYHGVLAEEGYKKKPFHWSYKSRNQLILELQDLKKHGIKYPSLYCKYEMLEEELAIRKTLQFPMDKLFQLGLRTSNPQSESGIDSLKKAIQMWKEKVEKLGVLHLYVYGIDEAKDAKLRSERAAWNAVHESGASVFVSVNPYAYKDVADILDVAISRAKPTRIQADAYHKNNGLILSYANPHTGEENPEVYRRNYGLVIWKSGYDGYFDYAYQKGHGTIWNDFDSPAHRDQVFTYPSSNGLMNTIQWEGFREGVNDTRFLSTLLNRTEKLKASGKNVEAAESFIESIDPSGDLDQIRDAIIDQILILQ